MMPLQKYYYHCRNVAIWPLLGSYEEVVKIFSREKELVCVRKRDRDEKDKKEEQNKFKSILCIIGTILLFGGVQSHY